MNKICVFFKFTPVSAFTWLIVALGILFVPQSFVLAKETPKNFILVSVRDQSLTLMADGEIIESFPISTASRGIGNQSGSYKTPIGLHRIKRKIGTNAALGTIFKGGVNTRRQAEIFTDKTDQDSDLILTRILWLDGMEENFNRGKGVDSFNRRIYIHGTNEEGLIGRPASEGCIRMKNADIVRLFELAQLDDPVLIQG